MKTPEVMHSLKGYIILIYCALCASSCQEETPAPNIVLILADDLGWRDAGFMGSDYYHTPSLDRLAAEGLVFDQAYASAANCAPSRACLMSGKNTPAHGIYTVGTAARGDSRVRRIIPVENTTRLDTSLFSLAEMLQMAGYTTIHVGKWHLGEDPLDHGFDYNVGGGAWGNPGSYFAPYGRPPLDAPEGEYLTERLTAEAVEMIIRKKDHPFFLYLPYYTVHTPIEPRAEARARYESRAPAACQDQPGYGGMVDALDRGVGQIMKELRRQGLEENTLFIFSSDNGGIRSISCQDPLRAGKGSYYEGGIRVPLVFRWPGVIRSGRTDEPASHLDFFPTLMDVCGLELRGEWDGISLWPLLKHGSKLPDRPLFFHFPVYLQAYDFREDQGRDPLFRTRPGSVIRKGPWKLHVYYEDGKCELYRLDQDPGEQQDLSSLNADKTAELLAELNLWLEDYQAPVQFEDNPLFDGGYEREQIRKVFD